MISFIIIFKFLITATRRLFYFKLSARCDAILHLHRCARGVQSIRVSSSIILISQRQSTTEDMGGRWEYRRNSGFQRLNGGTAEARV